MTIHGSYIGRYNVIAVQAYVLYCLSTSKSQACLQLFKNRNICNYTNANKLWLNLSCKLFERYL